MNPGEVLSPDAIAALVDAAREGKLPDEPQTPVRRRRRVHAVDFSRPTKFTSDQERRIKRGMEAFCRTATSRMSAELRAPLELEVINTSQLTWANAHAAVPDGALTSMVEIKQVGTNMMLSGEESLLLGAIELLSGGSDPGAARQRRLTDIDWVLASYFFDRLVTQMSVIWQDMFELELGGGAIDAHMETAQAAGVSEPTLTMTIEARLDGVSSTLSLLVPWQAIAPVIDRFSGRDEQPTTDAEEALSVRRAIGGVQVPVRAEVASVHLPIEAVLAAQAGRRPQPPDPRRLRRDAVRRQGPRPPGPPGPLRRPPCRPGHGSRARRPPMSSEDALIRLAQSSSEAVVGVLEMFAPGQIQAGDIAVLDAGSEPLSGLPFPAVATNVAYVDGVTGGNVFVMTLEGARRLAAAMMGQTEIEPSDATELTELELSAVSEAGNQMMATAAGAISSVLETEVEIGVPETRFFESAAEAADAYGSSPHVVRAAFSVCGEPCRLVQLVPNAFVVRMDRALDDLTTST